jgi:sulfate permease, SulP family
VFASAWLLLLLACTGALLAHIALPAIAALLLLVAWALFDLPGWRRLWREGRDDFVIAAITALATISIRLEMAILLGTVLSLVVYLQRTSKPWMRVMGFDVAPGALSSDRPFVVRSDVPAPLPECPQLKMIRMEGEVYFGAVAHVADQLRELRLGTPGGAPAARHLLVMAKSMNFIDLPAAELWRAEMAARRHNGGDLYFHRPRPPVMAMWQRLGFVDALGRDHIYPTKRHAIHSIFQRLDRSVCAHCTARVFEECQALPLPLPVSTTT